MKRRASEKRNSSASTAFVVCVQNDGYEASLERNKLNVVLPDRAAEKDGDLRVIDESGEDYLFAADRLCRSKCQRLARLRY
jgi:hypothetical protein